MFVTHDGGWDRERRAARGHHSISTALRVAQRVDAVHRRHLEFVVLGKLGGTGLKTSRATRAASATANDRQQEYIHVWERFALGLGCDRESATYLRATRTATREAQYAIFK